MRPTKIKNHKHYPHVKKGKITEKMRGGFKSGGVLSLEHPPLRANKKPNRDSGCILKSRVSKKAPPTRLPID